MRILTFTNLFPNNIEINKGIFIKERMLHVSKISNCHIKVVSPVPYFPLMRFSKQWRPFCRIVKKELNDGLKVCHPSYFQIPKIAMSSYGLLMFLSLYSFFKQLNKKFKPDIIDAHWVYPDGLAAVLLGKYLGKKVVVSARGGDINAYSRLFLIRHLIVFTLKRADSIITVSNALKGRIVDLGISEEKVIVIPNGVDTNKFKIIDKETAKQKVNILQKNKIILSIGALRKIKGHSFLIEAFSRIIKKEEFSGLLLLIIGDGEEKDNLIRKVDKLKIQDNVFFLGAKPHNELIWWYNVADLFCLPSLTEGWPNVIFESLACGVPVVASRVGGVPEVIPDENYGILAGPGNVQSLEKALVCGISKHWDRQNLSRYASENTWEKVGKKVYAHFLKILNS